MADGADLFLAESDLEYVDADGCIDLEKCEVLVPQLLTLLKSQKKEHVVLAGAVFTSLFSLLAQEGTEVDLLEESYEEFLQLLLELSESFSNDGEVFEVMSDCLAPLVHVASDKQQVLVSEKVTIILNRLDNSFKDNNINDLSKLRKMQWLNVLNEIVTKLKFSLLEKHAPIIGNVYATILQSKDDTMEEFILENLDSVVHLLQSGQLSMDLDSDEESEGPVVKQVLPENALLASQSKDVLSLIFGGLLQKVKSNTNDLNILQSRLNALDDVCRITVEQVLSDYCVVIVQSMLDLLNPSVSFPIWPVALQVIGTCAEHNFKELDEIFSRIWTKYNLISNLSVDNMSLIPANKYLAHVLSTFSCLVMSYTPDNGRELLSDVFVPVFLSLLSFSSKYLKEDDEEALMYSIECIRAAIMILPRDVRAALKVSPEIVSVLNIANNILPEEVNGIRILLD